MTTEAKLKKLEEDQIILEDQNCKLAKVRPSAGGTPRRPHVPPLLPEALRLLLCSRFSFLRAQGLWAPGSCQGMVLVPAWDPRGGSDIS